MKKVFKVILIAIIIYVAVWLATIAKCEYLSARYAHEFYGLEDDVCNLYPICENVKFLKYDGISAEVYYYEEKIGIWILFEKMDGKWKEVTDKCVWSTGSADDVVWPYFWHGYNGL